MSDETAHESNQISSQRQKIIDDMHEQMRQSRQKIDKGVLKKLRDFIFSNPALRQSFGLKKKPVQMAEPIDRSKNMDVIAKFLEMHPERKGDVSKILKKD